MSVARLQFLSKTFIRIKLALPNLVHSCLTQWKSSSKMIDIFIDNFAENEASLNYHAWYTAALDYEEGLVCRWSIFLMCYRNKWLT
jgi:hypothetical protein